jgi:DNA-binding GntR family transcriptional regulator
VSGSIGMVHYQILDTIRESENPIGAIRLKKVLDKKQLNLSEAKIGRILINLEEEGLIKKDGSNGRILTKLGYDKIIEYEYFYKSKKYADKIMNLINCTNKDDMIFHLDAREAIELKAIELVINTVPDNDLEELRAILVEQMQVLYNYKEKKPTKSQGSLDYKFHSTIIQLSGNPYLEAIYQLLRCSEEMQLMYEFIAGQGCIEEHSKIFEGISERNLEEACFALKKHIGDVKNECITYWENKKILEKYL